MARLSTDVEEDLGLGTQANRAGAVVEGNRREVGADIRQPGDDPVMAEAWHRTRSTTLWGTGRI